MDLSILINWMNPFLVVGVSGEGFHVYKGESISNQPKLFPVEVHLFFFDVIAL